MELSHLKENLNKLKDTLRVSFSYYLNNLDWQFATSNLGPKIGPFYPLVLHIKAIDF